MGETSNSRKEEQATIRLDEEFARNGTCRNIGSIRLGPNCYVGYLISLEMVLEVKHSDRYINPASNSKRQNG